MKFDPQDIKVLVFLIDSRQLDEHRAPIGPEEALSKIFATSESGNLKLKSPSIVPIEDIEFYSSLLHYVIEDYSTKPKTSIKLLDSDNLKLEIITEGTTIPGKIKKEVYLRAAIAP